MGISAQPDSDLAQGRGCLPLSGLSAALLEKGLPLALSPCTAQGQVFSLMGPTREVVCKLGSLGPRVLWKDPGAALGGKGQPGKGGTEIVFPVHWDCLPLGF